MKIGFFGTPEFSSFFCTELLKNHEIVFAVSSTDKASGRNRKVHFCPVKEVALAKNIPLFQPHSLADREFQDEIFRFPADAYVVVAYGKKIPREIFDHPPLRTLNLHPSLLPLYRGAAPIEWAIMKGEKITGITVQIINDGIDSGDIVEQEEVAIGSDMTAGDIFSHVEKRGAMLLNRALQDLAAGTAVPRPQDGARATYCGKIDKNMARIDWSRGREEIHNLIRGLNPKPAAWTTFRGMNFKVWLSSVPKDGTGAGPGPGRVRVLEKKRLMAGGGDGPLEILSIQPESKKIMDSLSFINGYRPGDGDFFL